MLRETVVNAAANFVLHARATDTAYDPEHFLVVQAYSQRSI